MIQHALPQMTGPHAALDQYGRLDHYYWRCESCGLELTNLGSRDWRYGPSDGQFSGRAERTRRCPRCAR